MSPLKRASGACLLLFIVFYSSVLWFQAEQHNGFLFPWYDGNQRQEEGDVSLNGLLPSRKEEELDQCRSRIEQHRFKKKRRHSRNHVPSKHLIARLRSYEEFHARCTRDYLQTWYNSTATKNSDCKFLVWVDYSGLGNKMVSIAASFLYALLTNRVLLIDPGKDMDKLFCEPFPQSSWFIPRDFPLQFLQSDKFKLKFDSCHVGKKLARYGYIEMMDSMKNVGNMFFCDEQQREIDRVLLVTIKANLYFVPALYNVPAFRAELDKLFPQQDAVSHHLMRYLFHPSNRVWSRVKRFYDSYMAGSGKLVGIQLRLLPNLDMALGGFHSRELFSKLMIHCVLENRLLPRVVPLNSTLLKRKRCQACGTSITVLVTSLEEDYLDDLREVYLDSPTVDGSLVRVVAQSNEQWQQTNDPKHDEKALAEMVLLSFCDELVTSPVSTFGYVAQNLGGIKPWQLSDTNCTKLESIEPCLHAQVFYNCNCRSLRPATVVQNNVKSCLDMARGIQLLS